METPPVSREFEAMAALLEPNRRRLYQFVERHPAAVSRDAAAEALGIGRALAAFHLDKLVGVGLLATEYRRLTGRTGPGAGRTSKLYRRSDQQFAVSLPQRDHELLARLLAESSASVPRTEPDFEPAREYGRSLGRHARKGLRGRPTATRLLACTEAVLEGLGFEPYRASATEVRLRNCPFDPLARQYTPLVCGLGYAMINGIVEGASGDQLHVGREERPDRCCGVVTAS